jgi:hypothetical protein
MRACVQWHVLVVVGLEGLATVEQHGYAQCHHHAPLSALLLSAVHPATLQYSRELCGTLSAKSERMSESAFTRTNLTLVQVSLPAWRLLCAAAADRQLQRMGLQTHHHRRLTEALVRAAAGFANKADAEGYVAAVMTPLLTDLQTLAARSAAELDAMAQVCP